jgi:hypothetical protein
LHLLEDDAISPREPGATHSLTLPTSYSTYAGN